MNKLPRPRTFEPLVGKFELIMLAIAGAEAVVKVASRMIESAKQNEELTPEQAAEVARRHKEVMSQAHWQVEP